jgi:hypothetical protein
MGSGCGWGEMNRGDLLGNRGVLGNVFWGVDRDGMMG